MKLPQPYDYQLAIQAPSIAFLDPTLRRGEPRRNPLGQPSPTSGGFALTFDVSVDTHRYAVRCFHKEGNHLQQRYAHVADFVRTTRLEFLVDVDYLSDGIRVGDKVYPIVRMQWIDGARLDDWIDDNLHKSAALERVRRNVANAVEALRRNGAAHGDLQHGNVLVRSDQTIRLVDYDGMYLPTLRPLGAAEQGHRNYQHPDRTTQYDDSLDVFAAAVVDLSLAALTHEPRLWKEFNRNSGERLLFSAEDFADPAASPLFDRLAQVPALAERARRLRRACEVELAAVPAVLVGEDSGAPAGQRRAGTAAAPKPLAIPATDRTRLLGLEGDAATVVGRVVAVKADVPDRRGGMITFINFGNYRLGAFTVVAWDRAGRDLNRILGDPATLVGSWVAVTGLLTVYRRSRAGAVTPQIELTSARTLRTLTAREAQTMLGTPAPKPTSVRAPGAAATPSATGARRENLDERLGRLYSSPSFTTRIANTGKAASTSATPAAAPKRPQPQTPPPNQPPRPAAPSPASPPPPMPPPARTWPPPHRRPPQYVPTQPYPPTRPPPAAHPPRIPANAAIAGLSLGVWALLACVIPPAGIIVALAALAQGPKQTETDRQCAIGALTLGITLTLVCGCMALTYLLPDPGTP